MSNFSRASMLISLLATIFYCVVVWYGGNLFAILIGQTGSENISNFSVWTILPLELSNSYYMVHWQSLAVASFLLSLFMTFKHGSQDGGSASAAMPLINHYGVLLLLTLINTTGFAVTFVTVCATI